MSLARLRETWSGLETRSQLTLVGSLLAVVVTLFLLYSYASKTSYATLATGLSPTTTGQAESALSSAGIPYRIENGGTQIAVPSTQAAQARVALAQKGVLNGGQVGFEIFDKTSLGTTDFQQQVNYQRALEGEIDKAIEQIQGVTSADVQLVLPSESLFASRQQKATAAVLVNGGSNLDASTIDGIAHLVAASVKSLDPSNVTITDETGALLWPTSDGGGATSATTKLHAEELYSAQLESQINALLTSTLGPGKALARVNADLDLDRTTLDKVTYGKKGIALSKQTGTETLKTKGGTAAIPAGTASNTTTTPTYAATGGGANSSEQYDHTTNTSTFGVDKTIQHRVVAPGTVNKLSVALVVDKSVPAAEVASLQKSVASLAGVTKSRGDTLAVSRVAFAKPATTTATKSSPLSLLKNPVGLAKDAAMGLAALVFLLLMRRALKRRESQDSVPEPTWLREIESGLTVAQLEAGNVRPALPSPEATQRSAMRDQVEEIAQNQPQAIASQVTQWMKE